AVDLRLPGGRRDHYWLRRDREVDRPRGEAQAVVRARREGAEIDRVAAHVLARGPSQGAREAARQQPSVVREGQRRIARAVDLRLPGGRRDHYRLRRDREVDRPWRGAHAVVRARREGGRATGGR